VGPKYALQHDPDGTHRRSLGATTFLTDVEGIQWVALGDLTSLVPGSRSFTLEQVRADPGSASLHQAVVDGALKFYGDISNYVDLAYALVDPHTLSAHLAWRQVCRGCEAVTAGSGNVACMSATTAVSVYAEGACHSHVCHYTHWL
jgi:hypothetical protein